jgi:nitrate reductase NapE component
VFGIVLASVGGAVLKTKTSGLASLQLPQALMALAICIIIFASIGFVAAWKQIRWLLQLVS